MDALELLLTRRSVKANDMVEPGPNAEQIQNILAAAHRVPDHGKIGPWRFVLFSGEARSKFGAVLRERFAELNPDASEKLLTFESERFNRAPLIIAVVASPIEHKVPEWEQILSSGACCQNMLLAAHAQGFAAQWLTEWYAYDEKIAEALKLKDKEKIAGFIYIGSPKEAPTERVRPDLKERIISWE